MAAEIWKPVVGYEGLYEVSNLGRVRTFHPKENNAILRPYRMKNGYLQLCLYKGKISCKKYVHRLVAEAFVENPDGKAQVNHIDENKENNASDNLTWTTSAENLAYGSRKEKQKTTFEQNGKLLKTVDCYSKNGELLRTYKSIKEAAALTCTNQSAISQCCKGKQQSSGGYVWRYHGGVCNGS